MASALSAHQNRNSQMDAPKASNSNSDLIISRRANDPLSLELEETEKELTRVHDHLNQLIEKRSLLKQKLNDRHSSILRIPDEIFLEIFMHCFPPHFNSLTTVGKVQVTPFQLGHICRRWRNIVWSAPKIWSVVTLDVCFHTNIPLVVEWLERSDKQPLSICIMWNPFSPDGERYAGRADPAGQALSFSNLTDTLGRYAQRWHTVDFRIPEESYDSPNFLHCLHDCHFPILTSFSLHDLESRVVGMLDIPYIMFQHAPLLREIRLSNCMLTRYIFPMNQMTHITLRKATLHEIIAVFTSCPLLTHCTVIDLIKRLANGRHSVVAPCLKSLTLDSCHGVPELLNHLKAPSLLELAVATRQSTLAFSNIISLVTRSSCVLERLSLSGSHIPGIQLKDITPYFTYLTELSLSSPALCNEFIHLLEPFPMAHLGSSECLLPKLQIFEYGGNLDIHSLDVKSVLLSRWKQSREGNIALLRRVTLHNLTRKLNTPALSHHPQRIAEGMYLSIKS